MSKIKHIHFIINPAAGNDEPILNTINDVLYEKEIEWDISLTKAHGDGEKFAREVAKAGKTDLIAAYGGDGTIADVANGLVDSKMPLMILPGGTGNGLAKAFNLPLTLREALEKIFECKPHGIDLGKTQTGRHFILRTAMGISANATTSAPRDLKDQFGIFAYVISGIQQVQNPPNATYKMTLDGEEVEVEGVGCVVANTNSIGALNLTFHKDVKPDDGLLDVFIIKNVHESLLGALAELAKLKDGAAFDFDHWQVKEAHIDCDPKQEVLGDGEVFDNFPLHLTVVPQAIQLMLPVEE
ncbi:MAG: diacylglycerol kinase family lipid kinase [Aggregatilineales bacterium]